MPALHQHLAYFSYWRWGDGLGEGFVCRFSLSYLPVGWASVLGGVVGVYRVEDALEELEELRGELLSRAEERLKRRDYDGVANILFAVDCEVKELVREGRRLRLRGELDRKVYKVLVDGYFDIMSQLWSLTEKYGAKDEVRLLYLMRLDSLAQARRR